MKNISAVLCVFSMLLLPYFSKATLRSVPPNLPIEYIEIKNDSNYICLVETLKLLLGKDENMIESIYYQVDLEDSMLDCVSNPKLLWGTSIYYRPKIDYNDLNNFEKSLFDYYKFNRKNRVTFIGPIVESANGKHKDSMNRSLHTRNKYQLLEWKVYNLISEIPSRYQGSVKSSLSYVSMDKDSKIWILWDGSIVLGLGCKVNGSMMVCYVGPSIDE